MEVIPPSRSAKKRTRAQRVYVPTRTYNTPAIPYAVSQPNRFWRIKKGLSGEQYWKKRYWRRRITGRGDYSVGSALGGKVGAYLGHKAGSFLGGLAQQYITGVGDYKIRKNVFLSGNLPEVVNQPSGGGTIIRFQEYLGDVITSPVAGEFSINTYTINAANPKTLPFLSQIACNYEQYSIEGMVFEFRSTSADALNSVNTALGTVMMATQYDVLDSPFESKLEMLNYEFSTSCKPSTSNMHMIECDPHQTPLQEQYCLYNQALPANADPRLYHLGVFSVATMGFQGTSVNVGELHVTYQVRLLKPKLFASLGSINNYWNLRRGDAVGAVFTNAAPLGLLSLGFTTPTDQKNNSDFGINDLGTILTLPRSNAITYYSVLIQWVGTVGAATARPGMTFANCSQQAAPIVGAEAGVGAFNNMEQFIVKINGTGLLPTITFDNAGVLPTGNQTLRVRVYQVTPEFF